MPLKRKQPAVRRIIPKVKLFSITKGENERWGVVVSERVNNTHIPIAYWSFDHVAKAERMRRLLCSELQLPIMGGN